MTDISVRTELDLTSCGFYKKLTHRLNELDPVAGMTLEGRQTGEYKISASVLELGREGHWSAVPGGWRAEFYDFDRAEEDHVLEVPVAGTSIEEIAQAITAATQEYLESHGCDRSEVDPLRVEIARRVAQRRPETNASVAFEIDEQGGENFVISVDWVNESGPENEKLFFSVSNGYWGVWESEEGSDIYGRPMPIAGPVSDVPEDCEDPDLIASAIMTCLDSYSPRDRAE